MIEMAVNNNSCEIRPDDSVKLIEEGDKQNEREIEASLDQQQPRRQINDRRLKPPPLPQQQDQKKSCFVAVTIALSILAVIVLGALAAAGVAIHKSNVLNQAQMTDLGQVLRDQLRLELQAQFHTVYTRWGNSTCPPTEGTSTLYKGLMAGHHTKPSNQITDYNGGTNFQCLPQENVEYALPSSPGIQGNNTIYGAEYRTSINPDSNLHNIPCAVCLVNGRTVTKMIPARTTCPSNLRREFYGYLMAQDRDYSTYECVDLGMEIVPGTARQEGVAVLVHVEASCNGLPCHPYIEGKELTCVICSI